MHEKGFQDSHRCHNCQSSKSSGDAAASKSLRRRLTSTLLPLVLAVTALTGCGGSASKTFTLEAAPSGVSVVPGGPAQSITISAAPVNGFSGTVSVAISSLPAGVTVSPSSISLTPGKLQQISFSAASSATPGNATIAFTGTSGKLTSTVTSTLTIGQPPPVPTTASLSTTFFDFGDNLVNNTVTQTVAVITNSGPTTLNMSPSISGDASYSIVSGQSCAATLAPAASCSMVVSYDPTVASAPNAQNAVLNMGFTNVTAGTQQTVSLTGMSAALSPGSVTATKNPQVALYTMTLPFPGSMAVKFGTSTAYGLSTFTKSTDANGEQVSIFVAGMKASTTYHMAATVQFANGVTVTDTDHTFTTQALPASINLNLAVATPSGLTPQSGVEMLNSLNYLAVTDLSGNILWTYLAPASVNQSQNWIQAPKMLPNGDILMAIGPLSDLLVGGTVPSNSVNEIREINLEGDTVHSISVSDLNAELATTTCAECNVTLQVFNHDVTPLPNGHWLVLANTVMYLSPTTIPALTNEPAQDVLGDVVVDLDQNMHPVWVWNEFNHLDPNRHPMGFPDWTHTNAVIYSPDDGNILVSMRHQNWVVKVDYENGTGPGNILWRLGEGGDFTLVGGTDPTDWQYAQHGPNFTSPNTTAVFSLTLMDNGNDRIFPPGVTCGTTGEPPCQYSTVPVFKIDESAMTSTLTFHQIVPANLYNPWGGNSEQLANGNIEYDLCGVGNNSYVYEVTQDSAAQTVWSLTSTGVNLYRAFRMPSLYPGVQW